MSNSMTGYGRVQDISSGMDITIEIKSVNHRYFDFSLRAPRAFGFLDDKLKSLVQSKVSRGKVDMYCQINMLEGQQIEIGINRPYLDSYVAALREIVSIHDVSDDISVGLLARNNEIFNVQKTEVDHDELWAAILPIATKAIEQFANMRAAEGRRLTDFILTRADAIEAVLADIEEHTTASVAAYKERLHNNLAELLAKANIDESRIVAEVAIMADKSAIDEEIVRLRSHIEELRKMLLSEEAQGRKIDFLIQEMNREINTIGSKCSAIEISKIVVDVKADIEKIREQVQNLE